MSDSARITECPFCNTRFRVTDEQLNSARGKVRCGSCLKVFEGVAYLMGEASIEPAGEPTLRFRDARLDTYADVAAALEPRTDFDGEPDEQAPDNRFADEALGTLDPVLFESVEPQRSRWWMWLLALLAASALIIQIIWWQREAFARDPVYRSYYLRLCEQLGCEVPVLKAVERINAQKVVVKSHPERPDALVVDAVIINLAEFPQPFPMVELTFTTINGTLVAGRRFKPGEYLAGELKNETLMQPATPIRISLEIRDPGEHAVNYFVKFY
ncbi:MAG: DUF3426 domain-containing protein [Proteobacteria bacterium]|nr:DUF3426 domain-containing protein [Pseudomonadota bacterium]